VGDGARGELEGGVGRVLGVGGVAPAALVGALADVGGRMAGQSRDAAEEVVEHVAPVAEHVEDDAAAIRLAIVPARPLRCLPIAFEYPVAELAAHREDAAEEAGVAEHAELAKPGQIELVLDDAALDAGAGCLAGNAERGVEAVGDRLLAIDVLAGVDRPAEELGFFGRIFSVRGEFGYWVFEGDTVPAQRPSWNYRKEDGGGIILDMLCHWRYVLDNLFGPVKAVSCLGATHIPSRIDEGGRPYDCTADDAAYASFELEGGIVAHFNSSWCVRVRRDDLLTVQVDGTKGTAVAGLRHCWIQHYGSTPRPVWNPDVDSPLNYFDGWQKVPEQDTFDNAFRRQWELFLRHVVKDEPFRWGLLEGAKGVQLAEKGIESWRKRCWVDIPDLTV